jgi:hypothetical protein
MGKINLARVVIGGLLAGLIMIILDFILDGVILAKQWEDAFKARNIPPMEGIKGIAFLIVILFALGLVMIWVYAAIRPRFGAGPKTAICAGLIVWALAYLFMTADAMAMQLFPRRLLFYGTLWRLIEYPIAAFAGAWLYKEEI